MALSDRREHFLLPMEGIPGGRMMKASQNSQKALAILKAKSNFKDRNSLVDTVT